MSAIAWSLALWAILNPTQQQQPQVTDPQPVGAIKLYQQAAELQSVDPKLALPILEQLIAQFPQSTLTAIATLRVAEQNLLQGDTPAALELLLNSLERVNNADTAAQIAKIDPNFSQRYWQTVQAALNGLSAGKDVQRLERWLDQQARTPTETDRESDAATKPVALSLARTWIVNQLVRRYAAKGELSNAIAVLKRQGSTLDAGQSQLRDFDLPMAILTNKPSREQIQQSQQMLLDIQSRSLSQQVSLGLAISEAQRELGDLREAIQTLEKLAADLQADSGRWSSSSRDADSIKHWQATVALRRSELQLASGNYAESLRIATDSITGYSKYPSLHHFRFLAARCHIAAIEFDRAREQLNKVIGENSRNDENLRDSSDSIVDQPPVIETPPAGIGRADSSASAVAQAWWMLGEIDFMQRQYGQALEKYEQAAKVDPTSAWYGRSLLQSAKCYELTSSPLKAMAAYQAVVNHASDSPSIQYAKQRLEMLTAWSKQATQSTSPNPTALSR